MTSYVDIKHLKYKPLVNNITKERNTIQDLEVLKGHFLKM